MARVWLLLQWLLAEDGAVCETCTVGEMRTRRRRVGRVPVKQRRCSALPP